MDFYLSLIVFFTVFGLAFVERGLLYIARRRGRDAPPNVPVWWAPPRCQDDRLNTVGQLLQLVFAPVGGVLMVGGLAYVLLTFENAGWIAALIGLVLIDARGIFVAACIAYAELDDASVQLRGA